MSEEFLGVEVVYPEQMSSQEARGYVQEQLLLYPHKRLKRLTIRLLGDGQLEGGEQVQLEPQYETVRRLRRITGYLSSLERFGDAKRAEEQARFRHVGERV